MPVNHADQVGPVVFRIHDLRGTPVADFETTRQVFEQEGNFAVASAHWSIEISPPAACQILAIIYDKQGNELARVAPRLTSVNWSLGYWTPDGGPRWPLRCDRATLASGRVSFRPSTAAALTFRR